MTPRADGERVRGSWLPRWSTIRGRVAIVLAVPTCLLLGLTGIGVVDRAGDWSAAAASGERVEIALDVQHLVRELQREQGLTSGLLVGAGQYRPELADTRRRVDAVRGALEKNPDGAGTPEIATALRGLDRLEAVRARVDDETIEREDGLAPYSEAISELNAAQAAEGMAHDDAALADGLAALEALSTAVEALAQERSTLNGAFAAGGFEPSGFLAFAEARGARETALADFGRAATQAQRTALADAFAAEGALGVEAFEARALEGADGSALGADAREWWEAATALVDGLHEVQAGVAEDISARTDQIRAAATRQLVGFLALGAAILAIAMLLATLAARSITRPLSRLAEDAETVAGSRLPGTVRAVQNAEPEDAQRIVAEAPVVREPGGADEVTRLTAALRKVERTAVELAAEQAVLRRNGSESLAHLGRRNQRLLTRQLRLITALESKELDPDALAELFELDHLATRMRRNADSLLILTGEQSPPRVWHGSVAVAELVRSAISEVEDYRRVALVDAELCHVQGHAVAELSHLLAELIENALAASPPSRSVEVYGWWDGAEYCVAVVDRGAGMADAELARSNARLAGRESYLVAPSGQLGHYVVGTIATRLGVQVEVRRTQNGTATGHGDGVSAYVALPATLLSAAGRPASPGGLAGQSAPQAPRAAQAAPSVPGNGAV